MMTRISTGNSKVSTYMGWDLEDSVKAYMYTPSIDQWDHGKVYKKDEDPEPKFHLDLSNMTRLHELDQKRWETKISQKKSKRED
jgi:hypothetical protein